MLLLAQDFANSAISSDRFPYVVFGDLSRGMNYLHENKPEAIIHRDLEPS